MSRVVAGLMLGFLIGPLPTLAQCCVIVPEGGNAVVVDEAPIPTNFDVVVDSLRRVADSAPPAWRGQGIEAWVHVGPEGDVLESRVASTSGSVDLDAVLLGVVQLMQFSPARTEGVAVDVWLRFPVSLRATGGRRGSAP